jgi:hypothetical protein
MFWLESSLDGMNIANVPLRRGNAINMFRPGNPTSLKKPFSADARRCFVIYNPMGVLLTDRFYADSRFLDRGMRASP